VSEKGIQVMDIVTLNIPVDTFIIDLYRSEFYLKKCLEKLL